MISNLEALASKGASTKSIQELLGLWTELGDVPTVDEGIDADTIEVPFLHFPIGTHREDIWHWFEAQNPKFLVGEIMNGGLIHE